MKLMLSTLLLVSAVLAGWQDRTPLPGPRAQHMLAATRDSTGPLLLAIGGRRSLAAAMEPTCLAYSPSNNSWTSRSAMHTSRGIGRAVALGNRVYVIGGCATFGIGLRAVESYDPVADSWHTCPSVPVLVHDCAAASWRDSLLYVLGGGNWSPSSPPTANVWLYNALTQEWDSATPLPEPIGAAAAEIIGDTVIVACGWTDSGPSNRVWRGIINAGMPEYIYWESYDTLPARPRYRPVSAVAGDRFYLAGGTVADRTVSTETWALDLLGREWTPAPALPGPLTDVSGAGVIGSRLHVAGGYAGVAPFLADHWCLNTLAVEHDVGPEALLSPQGRLVPDSAHAVQAVVRNFTANPESASVTVRVTDSVSGQLVIESGLGTFLDSADCETLDLGLFTPEPGRYYLARLVTGLAGDEDPTNDTLLARCRTASGSLPDGFGYVYRTTQEPDTVDFSWLDPLPGDTIDNWQPNADDGVARRDLPFAFPFYDTVFTRLYIGTNGTVQASDNSSAANRPFPVYDSPYLAAPFWDDLNLRAAGRVIERLDSSAALYTWLGVPRYTSPDDRLTFQVLLRNDGRVAFSYLDMAGATDSSTVGIQGQDGAGRWYLEYVFDAAPAGHQPKDSTTVVFFPPFSGVAEPKPHPALPGLTVSCPALIRGPSIRVRLGPAAAGPVRLELLDAAGRLLQIRDLGGSTDQLDWRVGRLAAGLYFIRACTPLGAAATRTCLVR